MYPFLQSISMLAEETMGGIGSGRHHRERRLTTDEVIRIDIRTIFPMPLHGGIWHLLPHDLSHGLPLYVKVAENVITIGRGEEDTIEVIAQVDTTVSPRNFGSAQPYFLCPESDCGRRVAILYLSGKSIACRHCSNLGYQSQHDDVHIRLMKRAAMLRDKLGGRPALLHPIPTRPRGMHQESYQRITYIIYALEREAVAIMRSKHMPQWARKIELLECMA